MLPFQLFLVVVVCFIADLKKDAKWFIGNIWACICIVYFCSVVRHRLQVCDLLL